MQIPKSNKKCAFSSFIILVLSFEEETGQKRTHIVDKIKLAVTGCNLGEVFAANCRGSRIMPQKCSRKCSVDKKTSVCCREFS